MNETDRSADIKRSEVSGMPGKKEDPKTVYADIIGLPHHQSKNRTHMSLYARAAQFAPFAALVGYDDMVKEEARLTDAESSLSENEIDILNQKLMLIADAVEERSRPEITVIYFEPDSRKEGGSYAEFMGTVKKIDPIEGKLVFYSENGQSNGKSVLISRIRDIQGEAVSFLDSEVK